MTSEIGSVGYIEIFTVRGVMFNVTGLLCISLHWKNEYNFLWFYYSMEGNW